jgi:Domain of unknown function (DUF4410)
MSKKIARSITLILLGLSACLSAGVARVAGQEKPTIVVLPFALASGVSWPYDMKQLQVQTTAELQNRDAKMYSILPEAPASGGHFLTLRVEILEWHPGNAAKRQLVGMGSGRESAKIHFELIDANGKKVFEHEDTVRTEFYASAYSTSVGQLPHPLADKIGKRIADAKLQ